MPPRLDDCIDHEGLQYIEGYVPRVKHRLSGEPQRKMKREVSDFASTNSSVYR
jgi:hypothetical protein